MQTLLYCYLHIILRVQLPMQIDLVLRTVPIKLVEKRRGRLYCFTETKGSYES